MGWIKILFMFRQEWINLQFYAQAVSTTDFTCPNYSRDGTFRSNNVSNFVGDSGGWYHVPLSIFLERLQRENNAEIIERYREDELELTVQLNVAKKNSALEKGASP